MPYIQPEQRELLEGYAPMVLGERCVGPGELNYLLTRVIQGYLFRNRGYRGINDAIGALECCKLEMYRRVASPYEDQKIQENGDVY